MGSNHMSDRELISAAMDNVTCWVLAWCNQWQSISTVVCPMISSHPFY